MRRRWCEKFSQWHRFYCTARRQPSLTAVVRPSHSSLKPGGAADPALHRCRHPSSATPKSNPALLPRMNSSHSNDMAVTPDSELQLFDAVFSSLVDELTESQVKNPEISDVILRFKEVFEYNIPFGKKNRGLSVVSSYRKLVANPSAEDVKLARILGWCVEWLQAFFLITDDIMDQSISRRGKSCWYRKENVGNIAINDALYVETIIYEILKKHCKTKPFYVDVMELFHEVTMQTVIGQALDLTTAPPEGKVDFSKYTIEQYAAIVKWKTAFYSFYLPVALALYMAGMTDRRSHTNAKMILLQMGHYFQVQDDFLDCFGDSKVIGKIGTDIEDNKCSWLVVQALHRVTEEQMKVLEANYGQHDPKKVAVVKTLYRELDLPQVYADYEESSYKELQSLIQGCSADLPKDMFTSLAQKIYKRQK